MTCSGRLINQITNVQRLVRRREEDGGAALPPHYRHTIENKVFTPFDFLIEDVGALLAKEATFGKFVYVMQHDETGPVKIGITGSVVQRQKQIQAANPYEINIRAVVMAGPISRLEAAAHRRLADYNLRGEWFDVSVLEAVEAIQAAAKESNCLALPIWESHAALVCRYGALRDSER